MCDNNGIFGGENTWIIILIILVFLCCCNGNGIFGGNNCECGYNC